MAGADRIGPKCALGTGMGMPTRSFGPAKMGSKVFARNERFSWATFVVLLLLSATALAQASAGSASPAGCERRFDQSTTGLPTACLFIGHYNAACGKEAVAIFAGDGTALVVGLAISPKTPTLFVPARVESATEGKLVRWRDDLELRSAPSVGKVTLDGDGRQLRVKLADPALQVGECHFDEFVGDFVGMVPAGQTGGPPLQATLREIVATR